MKNKKEPAKTPAAKSSPTKTAIKSSPRPEPKKDKKPLVTSAKATGSFAPPASAKADVRTKAKTKESTWGPARTSRPKFDVSYARWKEMDRAERKRLGLPVSDIGGQMGFDRFMTGITGKEYKMRTK